MYNQDLIIAMEVSQDIDDIYACERFIPILDNPYVRLARFKSYSETDFSKFDNNPDAGIKYCQDRIKELDDIGKDGRAHIGALKIRMEFEYKGYTDKLKYFKVMKKFRDIYKKVKDPVVHLSSGSYTIDIKLLGVEDLIKQNRFVSDYAIILQYFAKNVGKWIEENENDIITASINDYIKVNGKYGELAITDKLYIVPQGLYVCVQLESVDLPEPFCALDYRIVKDGSDDILFETTFTKSGWCGRCVDYDNSDSAPLFVLNPSRYGSPAR